MFCLYFVVYVVCFFCWVGCIWVYVITGEGMFLFRGGWRRRWFLRWGLDRYFFVFIFFVFIIYFGDLVVVWGYLCSFKDG